MDDWYWRTDDGKRIQVSDKKDAKDRFQCVRGITRMMSAEKQAEVLIDLVLKLHSLWHRMQRATRAILFTEKRVVRKRGARKDKF